MYKLEPAKVLEKLEKLENGSRVIVHSSCFFPKFFLYIPVFTRTGISRITSLFLYLELIKNRLNLISPDLCGGYKQQFRLYRFFLS